MEELKLEKGKIYCNTCLKQGILTELKEDLNKNFYKQPSCGHYNRYFFRYEYIQKYNEWSVVRGLNKNNKPRIESQKQITGHGICSMCGKENKTRDQNARGIECGCSKNYFREKQKSGKCVKCGVFNQRRSVVGTGLDGIENGGCDCCKEKLSNNTSINMSSGKCSVCGTFNFKRSGAGIGLDGIENGGCDCCKELGVKNVINNKSSGNCSICGIFNKERDQNARGIECGCYYKIKIGVASPEWHSFTLDSIPCNPSCKNYDNCLHTDSLKNKWGWCKESPNLSSGGFDRESFYADKFDIISFDSIDEEVTLDNFDSLKGELGVWARWTDENHGNYCLDVCKTVDIGGEMLSSLRSFDRLKNGTDEEKENELSKQHGSKYQNQLNDCGDGKIIFKLVAYCDSDEEALAIEAQYAHDNKAKYWSPEPGQKII